MEPLPHHYRVGFSAHPDDAAVHLTAAGLPPLDAAPPAEFGGTGTEWSPETLLMGAVASCFALSFRTVADASKLAWQALRCEVEGTLERQDRALHFTRVALSVELEIADTATAGRAERLLHKAEELCLITNSLNAEVSFQARIVGATRVAGATGDAG
jgi:organic hydroperoxide reductase OsmC/OhrA